VPRCRLCQIPGYRGAVDSINLAAKMASIIEYRSPRPVATANDYDVRLARVHGEFVRHRHPGTGGELTAYRREA
jgi:hypothetical protein